MLTPEFVAANGLPTDPDERSGDARAVAPAQDRHLHSDGRGGRHAGRDPASPESSSRPRRRVGNSRWRRPPRSRRSGPCWSTPSGWTVAGDFAVFAGDVVPAKKPDPAIYRLAVKELAVQPDQAVVVEDSSNGMRAALGAGLACVVTVSTYTAGEDFTGAALVVSSLGDPRRRSRPRCWPTRTASGPEPACDWPTFDALLARSPLTRHSEGPGEEHEAASTQRRVRRHDHRADRRRQREGVR